MWPYLKPILIIALILGFALIFTHSCVDSTGPGYYRSYYGGVYFIPGRGYYYRGRIGGRGGK